MANQPEQTIRETPSTTEAELALNGGYKYGSEYLVGSTERQGDILSNITVEEAHSFWKRSVDIFRNNVTKIVAVPVIATTALLATACSNDVEATPEPTKTSIETPSPEVTPSPTTPEQELTVEALQIPAGLSAEDYAQTLINDRFTKWLMAASFDKGLVDEWITVGDDKLSAWYDAKADEYSQIFADATFIPDWRNHPDLVGTVDAMSQLCAPNIEAWLIAHSDPTPYKIYMSTEGVDVTPKSDEVRVWSIVNSIHNNAAETRIGGYHPDWAAEDGNKSTFHFTTEVVGGYEYISSWVR